jgi:hypothetical protein
MFASSNKYDALTNKSYNTKNIKIKMTEIIDLNIENEQVKVKPSPPIFIRGILDFYISYKFNKIDRCK